MNGLLIGWVPGKCRKSKEGMEETFDCCQEPGGHTYVGKNGEEGVMIDSIEGLFKVKEE